MEECLEEIPFDEGKFLKEEIKKEQEMVLQAEKTITEPEVAVQITNSSGKPFHESLCITGTGDFVVTSDQGEDAYEKGMVLNLQEYFKEKGIETCSVSLKMSQEEQEAAKREEEWNSMKTEIETLRQEKAITDMTKRWMGVGYSEELATATAKAMADGEMDTVFKNHAKFLADREKALKTELLKGTPTPPAGDGEKKPTKDDIKNMTLAEKQKFATENPEAYKEMYSIKEE